ncbi:hypothetical protein [Lachnoclostridium phytofermentans]|uniref:Uncharacterized protein n=1 Tax=Lachnoclostridium phytofermentans (strain ATCC 700394 / DSM 18823 / ISDg) TaxID=357809 RepID=A9KJZ8_LACP7|nr:hypothetical protein [Lachnoclostridium phytofermentans]ABX42570.1 hypothetical protein Cphy_2204 [Lachnoclostridium phytofermentans ISDg]
MFKNRIESIPTLIKFNCVSKDRNISQITNKHSPSFNNTFFCIQTDFCNVASGNEKGLVENLVGYARRNFIFYDGELVTTYDRFYGTGKTEYRLEHYIDLLERKPRAVFQAKPVRYNVTKELLDWGKLLPGGNKEMVKLLRLCVDYGEEKISK